MHSSTMIHEGIFIVSTTDKDKYIVYSPLRKMLFCANAEAVEIINSFYNEGKKIAKKHTLLIDNLKKLHDQKQVIPQSLEINTMDKAVFILSEKCNLACTYCYAQGSRSSDTLSKEKVVTVIDHVFSLKNDSVKRFDFIGGGEPTATWNLLEWAIDYINRIAKQKNMKVRIGLTTNATLLDEDKIIWLKKQNVVIGISFDILPEIQNKQRCFPDKSRSSFITVDNCIKLLIKNNVIPRIRSTITSLNVRLMPEMVAFIIEHYPEIRLLHFEHVSDLNIDQNNYYNDFLRFFFSAKELAKANNVKVRNSIISSINNIRNRFCSGEFCITPVGDLVSCHRVSIRTDPLFKYFNYGYIGDIVIINENDLQNVKHYANKKQNECENCFAKWHCAGFCTYNKYLYSKQQKEALCDFTQKMIIRELENQLKQQ